MVGEGHLARRGLDIAINQAPFVGREMELTYLSAIFQKSVSQTIPRLVLIAGVISWLVK